jgi:phage baseplate assembly protein W|tara:strand:+ start:200 stop:658 length:459 start_codon:yes stop_codon:yes gene_type:complete
VSTNEALRNNNAFTDAQGQNKSSRGAQLYSDLDLFFGKNNSDNDVNIIYDVQAIKRSIRNLVLTNQYDKPFHPEIYSGVRGMLFELMTPTTAVILARQVEDVIENFEPRARLVGVNVYPDLDNNSYTCTIEFYIVNALTELIDLTIALERIR